VTTVCLFFFVIGRVLTRLDYKPSDSAPSGPVSNAFLTQELVLRVEVGMRVAIALHKNYRSNVESAHSSIDIGDEAGRVKV